MASVLEPWTGSADVISGALALDLDEHRHVEQVLAVPFIEWFQKLKTVGFGVNVDLQRRAIGWWSLVGVNTWIESLSWELVTRWCLKLELLAVLIGERVGQWVESQVTSEGQSSDDFWRCDKCVSLWVCVVTASEVTVIRGDDRVLVSLFDVLSIKGIDAIYGS